MKIRSNHDSVIAYGDRGEVLIQPGLNTLTDGQAAALAADANAKRHTEAGFLVVVSDDDEAAAPAPEAVDPAAAAVAKLRKQKKGEKKADFEARVQGYDAFLTDWFAMSAEERAALADTLNDEQKMLTAGDPRSATPE